jgi:deoxyribose-phosphate aldolase
MGINEILEIVSKKLVGHPEKVVVQAFSDQGQEYLLCASLTPRVTVSAAVPKPVLVAPERVLVTPKPAELAGLIDHTLLKPEATPDQVRKLCQEARDFQFAAVCVNPAYVPLAVLELKNTVVPVCAVVGFPLGNNCTAIKALETQIAVADGAREIDMVIHVGQLKAGNPNFVRDEIQAVVAAAGRGVLVKVILETCLLSNEEIVLGCQIAHQARAHFVKTSTGFNKAGATVEHVALMRKTVGHKMGVKAAGGIRDFETAAKMVQAGASRIGASASVAIVQGI